MMRQNSIKKMIVKLTFIMIRLKRFYYPTSLKIDLH